MAAAKAEAISLKAQSQDPDAPMIQAAQSAGVKPSESPSAVQEGSNAMNQHVNSGELRNITGPYDAQNGAPIVQFGKDVLHDLGVMGSGYKNIITTGSPSGSSESSNQTPSEKTSAPEENSVILPTSPFAVNHSNEGGVTSTPEQRSAFPAPPKDGQLISPIPGSQATVTTYQTGYHPDAAQVALSQSGIPFRNGYAGVEVPAYGTIKSALSTGMGVGKIDGKDSDVANEQNAAAMKARGILNPGSDAFKINEQINGAIKNGQPFGGLLTQFDKASNRPPVNPEIPKAPEPEIEHNPFGDSTTDQVTAALGGRDKLYEDNLPDYSKVRAMAAKEAQLEAANPGQRDARLAEVKKQDQDRWNRIYAEREMQQANADRPNDDPVWNAHIAKNQANAAHSMAIADGATEQQLKEHPEMLDKYLKNPNDFNSLGSQRQTNNLAMEAIRGKSTPELITSSMNSESLAGNNRYREELNRQAIAGANSQEGVDRAEQALALKALGVQSREEQLDWKMKHGGETAEERRLMNAANYWAARMIEREKNTPIKADLKDDPEYQKAKRQGEAAAKAAGFVVDEGTQTTTPAPAPAPEYPDPPKTKDQMVPGQTYMTKNGPAKWDGTQYVKING